MEIKTERLEIPSEKRIFDQVIEHSIDADFTLPEFMPEISRILKCFVTPMLLDRTVSGQSITIDGDAVINCIYSDPTGCINAYEYTVPFRKTLDLPQSDGADVCITLKSNYLNYRPTGQRRVDIHGAIGICIKATESDRAAVLSSAEGGGLEVLKSELSYTAPCGRFEKNVIIEEELGFPSENAGIASVITSRVSADAEECKIISGKVIVRGSLSIHMTYIPEGAKRCRCFETSIPFSQMLDTGDADDDCICIPKVSVSAYELKVKENAESGSSPVSIEAKLAVCAELYTNKTDEIITDAFSTKYEAALTFSDIKYSKLQNEINERYICKKCLEFTTGSLENIADLWSDVTAQSVKRTDEGLTISGTVTVSILGFDCDGTAVFFEKPLDFSYSFPCDGIGESFTADTVICICGTSFTLQGNDKVEIRADMSVKCRVFADDSVRAVTDIVVDGDKEKSFSGNFALAVYYGIGQERLWDIAKRYNTSVSSIMKANGIEGDVLTEGRMILIPCV